MVVVTLCYINITYCAEYCVWNHGKEKKVRESSEGMPLDLLYIERKMLGFDIESK